MQYVFGWSHGLAESGDFHVLDARDEKDARRQVRELFNVRRVGSSCLLWPVDNFRAELQRLVALNERGVGAAYKLSERRYALELLDERVSVDA